MHMLARPFAAVSVALALIVAAGAAEAPVQMPAQAPCANCAAEQTAVILFPLVNLRKRAAQTELFRIPGVNAGNKRSGKIAQ